MKPVRVGFLFLFAVIIASGIAAQSVFPPAPPVSEAGVRRFGLFIGANDGGAGRVTLRWAISDAERMLGVMQEFGGVQAADSILLENPTIADIYESFGRISQQISDARGWSRRVELMVYYSGHSDDTGLKLGQEHLGYASLRRSIETAEADVSIAILDSCASGAFTRLKGGTMVQPFLIDDAAQMTGYAYLTSSSEDEAAQESDRIGASFFTHFIVSGLRGAADASGDGKVTLNEAYHYAFNETLAFTEGSLAGPQHPSYEIALNGSGDLVLSEPVSSSSGIILGSALSGRFYVRNQAGTLVAELSKQAGAELFLGVAPGNYVLSVSNGDSFSTGSVTIGRDETRTVDASVFAQRDYVVNRTRGDAEDTDAVEIDDSSIAEITQEFGERLAQKILEDVNRAVASALRREIDGINGIDAPLPPERPVLASADPGGLEPVNIPFHFTFVPGFPRYSRAAPESGHFAFSPIISSIDILTGFQLGAIGASTEISMSGVQIGGIFGMAGSARGLQINGIFSSATELRGIQISGIFNTADSRAEAFQIGGIFNIVRDEMSGVQIGGIFNTAAGGYAGVQIGGIFNTAAGGYAGVQIGGIVNNAQDAVSGAQIAGILNNAGGDVNGFQVAGIVNRAEAVRGGQIGLVNIAAGTVYGTQIGLVNIADDMYGIPIGLFSWVRDGIHDLTAWFSGGNRAWIGTMNGSRNFYSIFFLGWNTEGEIVDLPGIAAGAGLGLRFNLQPFFFDLELTARRASEGESMQERFVSLFTGAWENTFPSARLAIGAGIGELKGFLGLELDMLVPGMNTTEFHQNPDGEPLDFLGGQLFPKFMFGFSVF